LLGNNPIQYKKGNYMKNPRTDTKVFIMLECFAQHGAMTIDEVIAEMGNISHKSTKNAMQRMLNDAVAQNYLVKVGDRYELTQAIEAYVLDVMEFKNKKPKRHLVASPYRNIWTNEMVGYTASLYRNKRGYEDKYK
jgi:hypothetical protein